MPAGNSNELVPTRRRIFLRTGGSWRMTLLAALGLFLLSLRGVAAETPLTEYQVKALFLLNFTKYVTWPPTIATTNTPLLVGIYGEDKFGEALLKAVESKAGSGRRIILQPIAKEDDLGKCHILFISDSEKPRVAEILARLKARPVLTV